MAEPAQNAGDSTGPATVDETPEQKLILVTGATGTQGGAVARELLERGYAVRAFTRDPDSSESRQLAELGAHLARGDFSDTESVAAAMSGVDGVFAVTLFWTLGFEGEIEQGKLLIDEAVKAEVGHFVLTSVASADEATGIPHFESKWVIEQYLHGSGLNWSVVRPVEFMDNWRWFVDQFKAGTWADPRDPASTHQWIASSDIGFFVAEAFDHPDQWTGRTLEIAGDGMSLAEFTGLLSAGFGHEVTQNQISWEEYEAAMGAEMAQMIRWFEEVGYSVDIDALREQYPGLKTAEHYTQKLTASQ